MPSRVSSPQTAKTTAVADAQQGGLALDRVGEVGEADGQRQQVRGQPAARPPVGQREGQRGHDEVEADVPEVVPDVLVPQVRRLGAAGQRRC